MQFFLDPYITEKGKESLRENKRVREKAREQERAVNIAFPSHGQEACALGRMVREMQCQ